MEDLLNFEEIIVLELVSQVTAMVKFLPTRYKTLGAIGFSDLRATVAESTLTNSPFNDILFNDEDDVEKFIEQNPTLIELSKIKDNIEKQLREKFRLHGYLGPLQDALDNQWSLSSFSRMAFISHYGRNVIGGSYRNVVRKTDINVVNLKTRMENLEERISEINTILSRYETQIKVILEKKDVC